MKRIATSKCAPLALCISTILAGCGGGNDSESVTLLEGFYKDSAVVGLPYTCGPQSGLTEENGVFNFPEGVSCTFYLDRERSIALRTLPSDSLTDGVVIYETDPIIGQILQSLDDDGNPDNGIVIDPSVVDAVIADASFNGFPSTAEEANELVVIIDANNGDLGVVSANEAEAHILKSLLTESDLYQNCSGRTPETALTKVTFNDDGNVLLNDGGELTYSLDGGSLTVGDNTYTKSLSDDGLFSVGEPLVVSNADGILSTLYATQEDAEAAEAETCAFGDATAPTITVNGESVQELDLNSSFVDAGATGTDNVDESVSVTSLGEVDTSTLGSYEITYSATDSSGNIAADVTRTVNVTNTTPPVLTLTGESTLTVAHGSTYVDAGATAEDAVDGTLTPVISGEVNTDTVGSYTLTYGVSDEAGNAAEIVTRTVTVADQRAPTISLIGDNVITVPHGSPYSDEGAAATDAVDGTLTPIMTGSVDTNTLGSYTLTYNVSDAAGNAATKVLRVVKVTDQTAPSISLVGDSVVTVAYGESYTDEGANAVDAVDGELSPSVSGSVNTNVIGSYVLTYNVSDAAGNNATAVTRTINVTDQSPPTITLSGEAEVILAHGSDAYIDAGASASDIVDGILDPVMSGSVDTSNVGTYILTYNVSDSAGNAAESVSRTVKVTDQTAPVITLVGDEKVPLFHSFQFEDYDGATVSDNVDESIAVQTTHDIDEFQVGTYTVTYTATDAAGNEAVPVTREVEVVFGFSYPASYYQYKSSPAGLGENNHEFLKLTITADELSKDEGIYQNGSVDYSYADQYPVSTLVDGVFVERTTEYTGSIVHTPFSSIIEDGTHEIRILDQQYPSGELISSYVDSLGLDSSHTMPVGSEVLTLGIKQIQATYALFGEYFSSTYISGWSTLDDLLTNDCAGLGAGFIDVNDYTMTIGFGCGQQDQVSGTLEGLEYVGGSPQITSDVGTWERVTLPDSDIEAVIVTINPNYFDDEEAIGVELMFVALDGAVYQGVKLDTDEEVEITVFNETAINAIIDSIL